MSMIGKYIKTPAGTTALVMQEWTSEFGTKLVQVYSEFGDTLNFQADQVRVTSGMVARKAPEAMAMKAHLNAFSNALRSCGPEAVKEAEGRADEASRFLDGW